MILNYLLSVCFKETRIQTNALDNKRIKHQRLLSPLSMERVAVGCNTLLPEGLTNDDVWKRMLYRHVIYHIYDNNQCDMYKAKM